MKFGEDDDGSLQTVQSAATLSSGRHPSARVSRFFWGVLMLMEALLLLNINAALASPAGAHDFTFERIEGGALPLADYRGKTLLLVNTASQCGFTGQYAALQDLWETYRDRGLVVLGVPSDDFGGQEPGTAAEIKQFCTVNFDIDFPMTDKVRIKGEGGASLLSVGGCAGPFEDTTLEFLQTSDRRRWQPC